MDLPIFSNNLKSSASWAASLDERREAWGRLIEGMESQSAERIREILIDEETRRVGGGIDREMLAGAAALVSSWAGESEAALSVERILAINRRLTGAGDDGRVLRNGDAARLNEMHDPTPAVLLPRMLENAVDWFSAPGFGELRPVEQAAVVYLRMLDMHPFEAHTETTALLAAGFFTERGGFPPLIVFADGETLAAFGRARDAAFGMLTQPLVEFFAEMLSRAMQLSLTGSR